MRLESSNEPSWPHVGHFLQRRWTRKSSGPILLREGYLRSFGRRHPPRIQLHVGRSRWLFIHIIANVEAYARTSESSDCLVSARWTIQLHQGLGVTGVTELGCRDGADHGLAPSVQEGSDVPAIGQPSRRVVRKRGDRPP